MACQRFANSLKARALDAPLAADAAAHLAVCSKCQAMFEVEEQLLATIDAALNEAASVRPTPEFVARLRAQFDRAPGSMPATWLRPAGIAAAVAIVAVLAAGRFSRQERIVRDAIEAPPHRTAIDTRPGSAPPGPAAMPAPATRPAAERARRQPAIAARIEARPPQILVPIRQREAVGRLFDSLRAGRPEVVSALMSLRAVGGVAEVKDLTIAPIQIEPLVVPALPPSAPILDK
jgi:hypothetical protein